MTDQPHAGSHGDPGSHDPGPGGTGSHGNYGSWQPVPGGGDYDPDQTMHVSFAAQLPPEPLPGEDPLGAHGPAGPPGAADPATTWVIPVIRDEAEGDSGEYSVGAFPSSWDQAPSPAAPTQSFPAGMFGQGAAAAQAARERARAQQAEHPGQEHAGGLGGQAYGAAQAGAGPMPPHAPVRPQPHAEPSHAAPSHGEPPYAEPQSPHAGPPHAQPGSDLYADAWPMPFTGPQGGDAAPWPQSPAPAAEAAWSSVVDDPEQYAGDARHADALANAPHVDGSYADAYTGVRHEHALDGLPGAGHDNDGPPAGEAAYGAGTDHGVDGLTGAESGPDGAHDPYGVDALAGHERGLEDGAEPGSVEPDPDAPDSGVLDSAGEPGAPDSAAPEDLARDGEEAEDAEEHGEPEPLPEAVEPTHSEHPLASYMLRVNGADRPVTDAWLGESLLYVLRERLGLAGAKDGCEQGECGACSVQVDGRLVASCLVPAATAAGSEVRTVEGLTVDGRPSDVQRALAESGAVQCGFCIPGMAMTAHDLLEGNHRPTDLDIRQALSGNLCRCTGYRGVLDAVRRVVADRGAEDGGGSAEDTSARVPHQGGPATPEATP